MKTRITFEISGEASEITPLAEQIASVIKNHNLEDHVVDKTIVPPVVPNRMRAPLKLYDEEPEVAQFQLNHHEVTGIEYRQENGTWNWYVNIVPEMLGTFPLKHWTIPMKANCGSDKDVAHKLAHYYEDAIDWNNATEHYFPMIKPVPTKVRMSTTDRKIGKREFVERRWETVRRVDTP